MADHDRMMQVMANLLSNAAKFSHKDGQVDIKISQSESTYRVEVIDHGQGIPIGYRDKVFERFTQADSSDTRQKGGTGLGLSISQGIIKNHGGKIDFTSNDQGTTFFFELAKSSILAEQKAIDGPLEQTPLRVLICEDDQDISLLLSLILQEQGYLTDVALSASEAKVLLKKQHYDAMTLDLGLPDQDGMSLIKELRSAEVTKILPIIVISANASQGKKTLNADLLGVVDWIQKPIDFDQLADSLQLGLKQTAKIKPNILHVEDEIDILKVVAKILEDDASVTAARTLAEAKICLQQSKFDLVLLDLVLPDGGGEELLPALHQNGKVAIPVVIFSGQEASADVVKGIKAELLKAKTSNEVLLVTIRNAIQETRFPKS
jgi:DNA-binding response OmpR family regulator